MTVNLVLKSLSAEMPLKDEENLLSSGQAGLREGGELGILGAGKGVWRCEKQVEVLLQYNMKRTESIMRKI